MGYSIKIFLSRRHLLLLKNNTVIRTYVIGVGKAHTATPTGKYHIVSKLPNPGGPFGVMWLGLSQPHYGIHGTNNPAAIGGAVSKKVDVRIIAATNRRLKTEVSMGRFREDLYYRLNVISIELPPLRERELDIPPITRHFIQSICRQFKRDIVSISDAAMHVLCAYRWPGNVRELRNVIENAIVFTEGSIITEDLLPSYLRENLFAKLPPLPESGEAAVLSNHELRGLTIEEARKINQKTAAELERNEILQLLDQYGGNVSQVARHMGISRNTIYRKMKNYKIEV